MAFAPLWREVVLTLYTGASKLRISPLPNFAVLSVPMRILVAEDDAPLADFLRQRLVQEQFAVQLASDGTEAQRLAANQAFDLVILDLNLPGTGGLDVSAKHPLTKAGFTGRGDDWVVDGGRASARTGCGGRRLRRETVCVRRAGRTDTSGLAARKPSGQRHPYGGRSGAGSRGSHR